MLDKQSEKAKWESVYASSPMPQEGIEKQSIYLELADYALKLLNDDNPVRTLEVGCGSGLHSLALAQVGINTDLLDFSVNALNAAKELFRRAGLGAQFHNGDAFVDDALDDYSLVFNSGVLEHYDFDEQVRFIRAMARRSRKYVLVLVPNRDCYWYWIWRVQQQSLSNWPWGYEKPTTDYTQVFSEAGLRIVDKVYFGSDWTEYFITSLDLPADLASLIKEVHKAGIADANVSTYMVGFLGVKNDFDESNHVAAENSSASLKRYEDRLDQAVAHAADALSLVIAERTQHGPQLVALERQVVERDSQITSLIYTVSERDSLVASLNQTVMERDGQVASINQVVHDRDEQVAKLRNDLSGAISVCKTMRSSRSWRMTSPLRFAARVVRYGLMVDDRRWFENILRNVFRKLPFSSNSKATIRGWYVRLFGRPLIHTNSIRLPEVGRPYLPLVEEAMSEGGDFLTPEHWDHRHEPYGVLCLPIIDWHFRFQRPQQIARQFAEKGHPVSYVSLSFGNDLAVTTLEVGIKGLTLPGRKNTNVYQEMPTDADIDNMAETLLRYMEASSPHPWVCIVQLPYWGPIAARLRQRTGCHVVYDCMDDHAGFSTNGEQMLTAEARLLRQADLVVASSGLLFSKVQPLAKRSVLIRNAVDYAHFSAVLETTHSPMSSLIVGYYGAIADWFNSTLVAEVARLRPTWRFVLIGSTFSADTGPLTSCPNISLPGEKPYAELPQLIANWDCCIIPFKRLPLTEATNPVKVYEMLAAGKPIVSVSLPELIPIAGAGHIAVADTAADFVREIENQVTQDTTVRQEERRRYASENTWEVRQLALDQAISQLYPLVSIVVVTYNNLALNRLCLESLFNDTDYPNYEVIVVDNASSDDTPAYLKSLQHPKLTVIFNAENSGFSAANNQGLAEARGEFLCLLNNDTVVTGSWLTTLVRHLQASPEFGLIGPVTNAISNEAKIPVGYRNLLDMPAWVVTYCRSKIGCLDDIPMLAFFCVVMPRAVFETVGLLDDRFGIGMFEDDDYNRRVRAAGYKVKLARDAYIHHWQRASFKLLGEDAYLETFYENEKKYRSKWAADALNEEEAVKLSGLIAASNASARTIIFAPSIGWNVHLFQRPHHLARVLAQDGYTVVFDCSNSLDDLSLLKEIEPRLFLFKGEAELLADLHKPVLWTFSYNYDYRDRFPRDIPVVYDWIDDLSVFPHDQKLIAQLHARAMKEATVVVAVARKLREEALVDRADAIYLPNAVEEGRFDHPPTPNPALEDKVFSRIVSSGKHIAGYYGALADWFDYELLAKTAELRPDWHFVLIGPDHDGSIGRSNIKRHRNITWLGPRNYQALPGYLHLFDVAMIPFLINDITLATSPLKLFEYFAGGKPVLSTRMPECAAFTEVFIADNADEFASTLDMARNSAKDTERLRCRAALAKENTWRARAHNVLEALNERCNCDNSTRTNEQRVMMMFHQLETAHNYHFFRALSRHLSSLADDPCLPMYFQFALSANDRGRAVVRQLANRVVIQGKRHLDVGCASGGFLIAFSEMGANSCGFDIDPTLLKLAKQNFKDVGNEYHTYLKDVTRLSDVVGFESSFDIITCNDVIEHVSDPAATFKHISLMLAEGGVAYFEIPNRDAAAFVLRDGHYSLFGITQLEHEEASEYYGYHAPGTPYTVGHYLRLPEYQALLDSAGLEMEVLDESLAGINALATIDTIRQIKNNMDENLATVPEQLRDRVGDLVGAYLTRANTDSHETLSESADFLLTYGASFWKILARKKSEVKAPINDTPVPEVFRNWKYIEGFCNTCGQGSRFFYQEPALYREQLSCEHCRSTSRYRSIARGLLKAIRATTGVEAEALSQLPHTGVARRISIYDTQPPFRYEPCAYVVAEYLRRCDWIDLALSSFKPSLPLGAMLPNDVINQNLEQLTFPNEHFDIVVTSDVMEHVRLDNLAHEEIARVLRSGGVYIFTVPHNRAWDKTLTRVQVTDPDDPSKDVHLLEPEYHGDANSDEGSGVLSYRAYGRDLDTHLTKLGFEVEYFREDITGLGIINTELYYCRKVAE